MMRKFFFTILSLGLAVGGESLALDVAAKHLEDYQQQRKTIGDEDALQELRLQYLYLSAKEAETAHPFNVGTWGRDMSANLALREKAYRLAETRYKEGLGTLWDVYETGIELYSYTESCVPICCCLSRPASESIISLEQLKSLRQTLSKAAEAGETRERWLKAEILWVHSIERDSRKVCAYRTELVELLRKRYQQGLATHWDVALAELDLMDAGLFLPPAEEVLQRWEEYLKAMSLRYEQMKQAAEAHPGYYFSKMMCELRLRQIITERTLSILKAVPSILVQQIVAEREGRFLPAPPFPPNARRNSD